jgi:dsRNA-specific ribonuclease
MALAPSTPAVQALVFPHPKSVAVPFVFVYKIKNPLAAAAALVHRLFDPLIDQASTLGAGLDWKTSLQELTAAAALGVPEYVVTETGPDHEKMFTAVAQVGGQAYGDGSGRSKKEAEQEAAANAWRHLRAELPVEELPAG